MKKDFPIFSNEYHQKKPLIYLDNASTTHKPFVMIEATKNYYTDSNSNTGRGLYRLAGLSQKTQDNTRKMIGQFINCSEHNIIFTSGCTSSINLASHMVAAHLKPKQKILLTIVEHHANILPWQRLAKEKDLEIVFIKNAEQLHNPDLVNWDNVGLVALTHVSNVTGQVHPIDIWCKKARQEGAISVIDGAQGIACELVDINEIQCDFYAFSSHKLYGPMGLGILYSSNLFLHDEPLILGGGIVDDVTENHYDLSDGVARFEAGTANVCAIDGFGKTLEFLKEHDWASQLEQVHDISSYLYSEISNLDFLITKRIENFNHLKHSHICSFEMNDVHSHDVGSFLAQKNIAVRVGHHCAKPLHHYWNKNSTIRASLGIYNDENDVNDLIHALIECYDFFK